MKKAFVALSLLLLPTTACNRSGGELTKDAINKGRSAAAVLAYTKVIPPCATKSGESKVPYSITNIHYYGAPGLVYQRTAPTAAFPNGYADITVTGTLAFSPANWDPSPTCLEFGLHDSSDSNDLMRGWSGMVADSLKLTKTSVSGKYATDFTVTFRVPAGLANADVGSNDGMYKLFIRAVQNGTPGKYAFVGQIGVGHVYVIAGQSNGSWNGDLPDSSAAGAYLLLDNREGSSLKVYPLDDNYVYSASQKNSPAWFDESLAWTDNDNASGTDDGRNSKPVRPGSYWPSLSRNLFKRFGVPTMFVPVNRGGTTISDWLPNAGPCEHCGLEDWAGKSHFLFDRMANAVSKLHGLSGLRAVIWHQGESEGGEATNYAANLGNLISTLRSRVGDSEIPFLVSEVSATVFARSRAGVSCSALRRNSGAGVPLISASHFCPLPNLVVYGQRPVMTSSGSNLSLPKVFLGAQADRFDSLYRRSGYRGHRPDGLHFTNRGSTETKNCAFVTVDEGVSYCDGFSAMAREYEMAIANAFFKTATFPGTIAITPGEAGTVCADGVCQFIRQK